MIDLVMGVHDPIIVVTTIEAVGGWPHDRHRRLIGGIFDQKEMEVKVAQLVTKQVMLYPLDPTTRKRDTTQSTYTFRLIVTRPEHEDYDEEMEVSVAKLTVQIESMYPPGAKQWDEVHPDVQSHAPGTKVECEVDLIEKVETTTGFTIFPV
jgi:hypothetical protein